MCAFITGDVGHFTFSAPCHCHHAALMHCHMFWTCQNLALTQFGFVCFNDSSPLPLHRCIRENPSSAGVGSKLKIRRCKRQASFSSSLSIRHCVHLCFSPSSLVTYSLKVGLSWANGSIIRFIVTNQDTAIFQNPQVTFQ